MKTFNIIKFAGILFVLAGIFIGCKKQDNLFQFTEQPYPLPPPPPPLSNDLKNVKFSYNGAVKETSMSARRTFIDETTQEPSGTIFYRKGFELIIRLDEDPYDYSTLSVTLPLDDKGDPKPGIYTIKDNEFRDEPGADVVYRSASTSNAFPTARYSINKDKYSFNLTLRLAKFDPLTHEVAGNIDELSITDKSNGSKSVKLKDLGFTLVYDHFEVYFDDVLTFEGTTDAVIGNSTWYLGYVNSKLFAASPSAVFKLGTVAFNILDFKGIGDYAQKGEYDVSFGSFNNGILILENTGSAEVDGFLMPAIYTIGDNEIKVETWLENVLIKGSISGPTSQIWGNNTGGYYSDTKIPSRPDFKLTGSFFQRQL